jgi:uncharacterized protein (TIGR04222 family)
MRGNLFEIAAAAALAAALVVRVLPTRGRTVLVPGQIELAAVHGGERAAVLTALSAMAKRGEVAIAARGGVRRGERPAPDAHPLEHALWRDLHARTSPAELALRPRTAQAMSAVGRDVAAAGLRLSGLRWVLLRLLLVAAAGLAVLGLSVTRGRPHVVACLLMVVVAVLLWRLPRRTLAGERALRRARAAEAGATPGLPATVGRRRRRGLFWAAGADVSGLTWSGGSDYSSHAVASGLGSSLSDLGGGDGGGGAGGGGGGGGGGSW